MYTPKIKPEYIQALYKLKHSFEKPIPITRLVNMAVKEFLQNQGGEIYEGNTTSIIVTQDSFRRCEGSQEGITG